MIKTLHERIREIGYFHYIAGCVAWGLFVYVLALIFTLGELLR